LTGLSRQVVRMDWAEKALVVLSIVFGAGMLVLDRAVGLPAWWIVCEGPLIIALGAALLWLAAETDRQTGKAES